MKIPKHWIHIIAFSFVAVVAFQNCSGKDMRIQPAKERILNTSKID